MIVCWGGLATKKARLKPAMKPKIGQLCALRSRAGPWANLQNCVKFRPSLPSNRMYEIIKLP